MYLIRLDDAAENRKIDNWNKIEDLLDKYEIKPLVGVIPHNEDTQLLKFEKDCDFWRKVKNWQEKKWTICMHGYNHVYSTKNGGVNPINERSEFAGNTLEMQEEKINKANEIFQNNKIHAEVFFAPSHTFDLNTIQALMDNTDIKIISDTIANDIYYENGMYFIPQQSGKARKLPFKITTFCYHPNEMTNNDFEYLEKFIINNKDKIGKLSDIELYKRKKSIYDNFLIFTYFLIRKMKKIVRK